jgi:hypothetical protein
MKFRFLKSKIYVSIILLTLFLRLIFPQSAFADTVTLSGNVSDSSNNNISGASIDVADSVTGANVGSTTTDSSGNYTLVVLDGTYDIQVTPPAGSGFTSVTALSQNISTDTILNFILVPIGSVTLSGHVYDALGNALENQTVYLKALDGTQTTTTTDSLGSYLLEVSSGTYHFYVESQNNPLTLNAPQKYTLFKEGFPLTESKIVDITIPAKKVDIHVQDAVNNPVSDVEIKATHPASFVNNNLTIGGITNMKGESQYGLGSSPKPKTDGLGNVTLWLLPSDQNNSYNLTVIPPSGSPFNTFTLSNFAVTGDQTEIFSLQYSHDTPVTTATLETENPDGTYSDPTTLTLSATAAAGFIVANTFYTVDGGSQQTYSSPFTITGEGEHTITYWSVDDSGVQEAPNSQTFAIQEPEPVTVTFDAFEDTYIRSGQSNRNLGGGTFLRVRSSGKNRALVKFDQAELQSTIGSGEILSARLQLMITDNGNNWGTEGRTVDIHRLIADWVEGNGTEDDRGIGPGATWNCAIDSLIENRTKDCSGSTEWEMGRPNDPSVHPWVEMATDTQTITNNQTGVVEYDITDDLASFMNGTNNNYGWIIRKTKEGQSGKVSFGSKESPSAPQLVVTYQP